MIRSIWVIGVTLCIVHLISCAPVAPGTGAKRIVHFKAIDGAFRTSAGHALNLISPIFDTTSRGVRLGCARNEALGFFLVLESGEESVENIVVSADSLASPAGSLDVAAITFFRAWFVETGQLPGWHIKALDPQHDQEEVPDVLIPASAPKMGQPYSLARGQKLFIWVDIAISSSVDPGHYSTTIRFSSNDIELARIPLAVEVWPFELPEQTGVALLAPLQLQKLLGHHLTINGEPFAPDRILQGGPLYDQSVDLIHRTLRLLQRHHLSPFLTGLYPIINLSDRGELTVDWKDYDTLVAPFLGQKLYPHQPEVRYWPVPFSKDFPTPPPYDALSSPTYTRNLRQYLSLCSEHFIEQGWIDQSFVMLPSVKDVSEASFHTVRRYAGIARLATNRLSLVSLLPPQDLRPYGWEDYPFVDLSGYIDIWCPQAQFFDRSVFAQPQYHGQRKWFRLDRPPYSGSTELAASDTFARVIPWQAARLEAEAVLLPEVNNWTSDYTHKSPTEQIGRRPAPLILPGQFCGLDEPLPTLRLKMLRQGMQDLAYLRLCKERGLHRTAGTILRSLCRYAGADAYGSHFADGKFEGWLRDPAWWNYAKNLMARALRQPTNSDQDETQDDLQSIEWQRFLEATQRIKVQCDGVRVQRYPGRGDLTNRPFNIEFLLTLVNHTDKPVQGNLTFGKLPLGWTAEIEHRSFDGVQPYSSGPLSLFARADTIPAGPEGTLKIPIVLQLDGREPETFWARVAHISVRRLHKPITLDGDLSDWPIGIGNVVSYFSPISGQRFAGHELDSVKTRDVVGLVCSDGKFLYLGFHCFTKERHIPPAVQRSFLEYDDLVPVGEELLEILIDPSNGRSNSPSDLYHIAIKPSGTIYAEHGIRANPQVGYIEDWSPHVQVVTRSLNDQWITEIRIPLASFGALADPLHTWGINFCRFEAAGPTYTTWSGATWNAYNPITLGNMSFAD